MDYPHSIGGNLHKGYKASDTHQGLMQFTIQKFLNEVQYPASKLELMQVARNQNAPQRVVSLLRRISERTYYDMADVAKEAGGLRPSRSK